MDHTDITLANLEDLMQNPAWRLFIHEQKQLLSTIDLVLRQKVQTETIEDVRFQQGRVSIIEDTLAWVEETKAMIEEEQQSNQKQTEEEQDNE